MNVLTFDTFDKTFDILINLIEIYNKKIVCKVLMFLTTKSQYAVNAMIGLCNSGGIATKLVVIALNHQIDAPYLEKIFTLLKASGLIISVRGPGGGYKLSKPSDQITINDIVNAVNENIKITRCKHGKGGCSKKDEKCKAHLLWLNLENYIKQYLSSITLQEIAEGKGNFLKFTENLDHLKPNYISQNSQSI